MSKQAFTLLELLVTISIISILTAVGSIGYSSIGKTSRDARRKTDLREMQLAVEKYYQDNGSYPTTTSWHGLCSNPSYNPGGNTYQDYDVDASHPGYIPGIAPTYMTRLPHDPKENQAVNCGAPSSCYLYISNGTNYKILAYCTLEGASDPNDPFYDPVRPATTLAVYTPGARAW